MKKLFDIIGDSKILSLTGSENIPIHGLKIDSREVSEGDMYIAIKGYTADGHDYIDSAIQKGAKAVLCEDIPSELDKDVSYVQVTDTRESLGQMAKLYYDNPSSELDLVGITGTNGKTTVATLLYQLFTKLGYKVGLVSTVENRIGLEVIPSTHTTPDVVSLQALLRRMADEGCTYVFMEVSSHAVDQRRIAGVDYSGGVFTNMSRDHLDYHKTFDNYIAAKKRFFDDLRTEAFAVTNLDDKRGQVMLQNSRARKVTYSLQTMATYKGKLSSNSIMGLILSINGVEAHFRMVGAFNAYNLLAVYATAAELCMDMEAVLTVLTDLQGAEGRFEKIASESGKVGIVDYAHTPDALLNVLQTIVDVKSAESAVITVVGCGGDRDKGKRPEMAAVAARLSSKVILTSDNPRMEDPEDILDEMEEGLSADQKRSVLRITNRKQAIEQAVMLAQAGDIILIAGKGHEKYQEINGVKHPFDDKRVLRAVLLDDT